MSSRVAVALLLAALAPGALHAQHPVILQKLAEWDAASPRPSPDLLRSEILKSATASYADIAACKPMSVEIDSVASATADRTVFTGILAGRIRNGWTIVAHHPGCDVVPVRYLTILNSDGSLVTSRVNRGQSLAHDSLIGDTLPAAFIAAQAKLARAMLSCADQSAKLGTVRLETQKPDLGPDVYGVRYKGTWSEVWPILSCGRSVEVPIDFTADGDGGAYWKVKTPTIVSPASR